MEMRRSQLDEFPVEPGRVLFLGDSITEGGVWNEWFPRLQTLNRGVGGDTVSGMSQRVAKTINKPALITLLIGTNDLGGQGPSTKVPDIANQMHGLVERIRELAPATPLLINSILPRTPSYADRISELNGRYREIAAKADAEYVDLWPAFAGAKGELKEELTGDNVHLNGYGYRTWAGVLAPKIQEHVKPGT